MTVVRHRSSVVSRTYTYSDEDQVITAGDLTYRYDVDGFLAIKNVSGTTTTYEYATRGELMKVVLPSGDVIEYINDPLGRRIAKKVNGTITEKYLWQGLTRLLAVYDDSDNFLECFIYADNRLPVAMQSGGNTYYLAYDQVGSLISVADSSGNVIKSVTYDSFGNIIQDSAPIVWIPIGFAGGMIDADTGLVRFGFREYSPEIGRWTAKDPILFQGGMDLYGYCLSDPVNIVDPIGLDPHTASNPLTACPDPCSNLLPGTMFPGSDIDENIEIAASHPTASIWFYNQVRNSGPWDYKQHGKQYEDFGNFNFGATGSAVGFAPEVLQRGAGWAQERANSSDPSFNHWYTKFPYGDDPNDQFWILKGIQYYNCRKNQ